MPRTTSAERGGRWNEPRPAFLLLPTCRTPPTARTAGCGVSEPQTGQSYKWVVQCVNVYMGIFMLSLFIGHKVIGVYWHRGLSGMGLATHKTPYHPNHISEISFHLRGERRETWW